MSSRWKTSATVSQVRLRVTKSAAEPHIRKLAVYNTASKPTKLSQNNEFQLAGTWKLETQSGPQVHEIDLSKIILEAAQFEVVFEPKSGQGDKAKFTVTKAQLLLNDVDSPEFIDPIVGKQGFNLNITGFPTGKWGLIRLRAQVETINKKPASVRIMVRKCPVE
jgi:hypothetical protein